MRASARLYISLLLLPLLSPIPTTSQFAPSSKSPPPTPVPPGLKALEQARSQFSNQSSSSLAIPQQQENTSEHKTSLSLSANAPSSPMPNSTLSDHDQQSRSPLPLPTAICTEHVCHSLHTQLSDIIDGRPCRSIFINGKCTVQCSQMLSKFLQDEYWVECKQGCANDVTSGVAQRWQELCDVRMETLIDQGKEAVKSLVNDGLNWRMYRRVLQFFLGTWILIGGVIYGYRRLRMVKGRLLRRRLFSRKNSDSNLPV